MGIGSLVTEKLSDYFPYLEDPVLLRFVVGGCLSKGYYSMETGLLMYFRVFLIYFVPACLYQSVREGARSSAARVGEHWDQPYA